MEFCHHCKLPIRVGQEYAQIDHKLFHVEDCLAGYLLEEFDVKADFSIVRPQEQEEHYASDAECERWKESRGVA